MGGISASTGNNILYGTDGYLLIGETDLGATLGDFVVEWGYTAYYPDFAQARGPVAGTGKVSEGFFRLRATLSEWSWTMLSAFLGTIGAVSSGDSYKFGGGALENITELTNVILTGIERNDGKDVKATIPSAYCEVGNLTFAEATETGIEVTFHGLFALATPTTLPGYIEVEK